MLTARLKAVLDSAAQLPPEAQDKLAAQLESAIANAAWDADLSDPQNGAWLQEWMDEARQEETVEFPISSARCANCADTACCLA